MKLLALLALFLTSLFSPAFGGTAFARNPDFDGMLTLPNGLHVYAIQYKAVGSAPTIVFLHGLTYTTKPWQNTVADLAQKDYGIVVYDMRGMGKTLNSNPLPQDAIPLAQQVEDLSELLDALHLDKANLAGLSYGGAVGLAFAQKNPARVDHLLLMAPYVKALGQQDQWLTQQAKMFKMMHPFDKRSDDEIYDEEALKPFIFQYYPMYEPAIKDVPNGLQGVYENVRGVRKFKAVDIVRDLANTRIHLIMAGKDQYVPAADHMEFWNALPTDSKLSRIVVAGSEHKLPEASPTSSRAGSRSPSTATSASRRAASSTASPRREPPRPAPSASTACRRTDWFPGRDGALSRPGSLYLRALLRST